MASPTSPELLADFFAMGKQESISPFLKLESRHWSVNLTLKAASLAAGLLLIAFILSFFPMWIPLSHFLLLSVYFLAGIPSLIEAMQNLSDGEINIDILMTLAAFSSVFIGSGMEGGLLLVLFALSGAMEDAVANKAKSAISGLHKIAPTKACVIDANGILLEKAIQDISVGTHILIKAGQVVPLDGTVIEGASSVNLVHLTGENLPVTKTVGDPVPAGGRNLDGALILEVTRTSADSTLARIIQLITQAQEARPALQRWFDKVSRGYAIAIISLSALFALLLPLISSVPFFGTEGSLYRAVAFLIAASPCALIIAIPIAYLSAISICARRGVLLKGGLVLDSLAKCRAVAFDKTGTLTAGKLTCLAVEPLFASKKTSSEALSIAYAMEKNAVHPIAQAILNYAAEKGAKQVALRNFKAIPGYGLEATVILPEGPQPAYIGKPDYIANRLSPQQKQQLLERTRQIEGQGEALAVLLVDQQLFIFRFADTLRPQMRETIQAIKKRGWDVVMLTGDHASNAQRIASELGLDEVHADLLPEDKLHYVSQLAQKKGLAMIGDGINDAPALARATVGICMGKVGSSTAIEAADIILLQDNIELLDWLIGKAKQTQAIVTQNLILAAAAIIVASLPALGGFVPLWLAVVMHEGGTVLVGLNALRLLRS